jgi:hypothetical protein
MAQPTSYDPAHEFLTDEGVNPHFPGSELDIEFAALQATLDQILANLVLIQRDDGALKNGIVTTDSLDTVLAAAFGDLDAMADVQALIDEATASATAAASSASSASTSATAAASSATSAAASAAAAAASAATIPAISGTPTAGQIAKWTNATTLAGLSLVPVANGGTNLASGTSGGILGFTAAGVLASSVALTANALLLGGGAGATPTPMGSLGTTTTVLHGNAAGAPTFGAVSLTADVSGTLPVANGGSGVSSATAYAVLCGGTTSGGAFQSIASVGSSGQVLTSNGAGALPTFQNASAGTAASQANMEAASDNTVMVTPLATKWHPGVAKGWCEWGVSSTIGASQNVSSVTDTGTGNWTVNWTTSFSSANYAYTTGFWDAAATSVRMLLKVQNVAAGSITIQTFPADATGTLAENASDRHSVAAFGDFA